MSVRYAILGVLAQKKGHGYAVHAACEALVGDFLEISQARVYEVLSRLEEQGFATSTQQRTGRRRRRVYAILPLGKHALQNWALAEPRECGALRDLAFRLLVAGSDPQFARSILRAWESHEKRRLAQWRERQPGGAASGGFAGFVRDVNAAVEIRRRRAGLEILRAWRRSFESYEDGAPAVEIVRSLRRRAWEDFPVDR